MADGAATFAEDCPASYRRRLTERGYWLDEPSRRLTDGINQLLDRKGASTRSRYLPARRRPVPHNPRA